MMPTWKPYNAAAPKGPAFSFLNYRPGARGGARRGVGRRAARARRVVRPLLRDRRLQPAILRAVHGQLGLLLSLRRHARRPAHPGMRRQRRRLLARAAPPREQDGRRNTSHLTRHTSHLTPHTSRLTPHTSPQDKVFVSLVGSIVGLDEHRLYQHGVSSTDQDEESQVFKPYDEVSWSVGR